jgi:hypothetical protein
MVIVQNGLLSYVESAKDVAAGKLSVPRTTRRLFRLAGACTTTLLLTTLMLTMVFFPKVQKKVQEDLDRVVGPPPYFGKLLVQNDK